MRMPSWLFLSFVLLLCSPALRAQFYVTPTPLHDACQRNFPVEAARVLAWGVNQKGGHIAKITWEVKSLLLGDSEWKIAFVDAAGTALHTAVVKYGDADLAEGPRWYRSILSTLAAALPPSSMTADMGDDEQRFWRAGEVAGDSRMSSVHHILTWLEQNDPATAGHAAQLAGLLTHAALPSMSGMVTLDGLVLARAATWLCLAEQATGKKLDAEWCPILFMAGREPQAVKLWPQGNKPGTEAPVALQWWHHTLTQPLAKDAFIFAGDTSRMTLAVPFLARFARIEQSCGDSLLQILGRGGRGDAMRHLHDYAPLLIDTAGVGGGHFATAAPYYARREWLVTLQLAARAADPGLLNVVDEALEDVDGGSTDPSLASLGATASLLRDGDAGAGDFTPVAAISLGDLLVFGYDNTLLQMVARHYHVDHNWGVKELSREIRRVAFPLLPHLDLCLNSGPRHKADASVRLERFETFDWFGIQRWAIPGYNEELAGQPVERAARIWLRHSWGQHTVLSYLATGPQPRPKFELLVDRMESEGGEECLTCLDKFLRNQRPLQARYLADASWQERLTRLTPNNVSSRLWRTTNSRVMHENPLALAQQMEREYWTIPGCGSEDTIFLLYLEAGALDAARRFYDQAHEVNTESVGFSNKMANRRWMLAFMEEDKEAMEKHRFDASTFSYSDITKNFLQELAAGNDESALAHLNAGIERYDQDKPLEKSMFKRMRDFMPLLPALADPQHARHVEALQFFQRDDEWPTAQWLLIQRCKLPQAEAELFLGGEKTNPERLSLIAYLRGDKELFDAAVERTDQTRIGNMARVVTLALRAKLHHIQAPADQPDLRPTDAVPLHDLTLRGLGVTKNKR